jgi:hypothetical protein
MVACSGRGLQELDGTPMILPAKPIDRPDADRLRDALRGGRERAEHRQLVCVRKFGVPRPTASGASIAHACNTTALGRVGCSAPTPRGAGSDGARSSAP